MTHSTPQSPASDTPLDDAVVEALTRAVDAEFEQTLATLGELVAHGGIAWDSFDRGPLERSAEAVERLVAEAGLQDVRIVTETREDGMPGGPAVLGHRPAADGKPTVLLYAHHDVQPTGDESLWDTPPFTATRKGDRLFGRGAADDKAGIMVHLAAVKALQTALPEAGVGVRVFIEGEEEAGSPTFRTFLENQKDDLEADAIVVADSANWAVGVPALTTSLRGVADGTVTVRVLDHAVHSGMFGGPVLDAVTLLCRLIATLHDEHGTVAVPGVGAQVQSDVDYSEQTYRADAGVLDGVELAGSGALADRLWNGPALSIIGIDVPSVDNSSNTIQPSARAKWSLRVGPGVDPEQAYEAVTAHLAAQAETVLGAEITFEKGHFGQPFATDTSDPHAAAMMESFHQAWGVEPKATGLGGSIPFTADLQEVFPEATILITGVEDPDSRAHSANESLHVGDFRNAILAEALWLARLSR